MLRLFPLATLLLAVLAIPAAAQDAKPVQPDIAAANQALLAKLPFNNRQDFDDATRGLMGTDATGAGAYAALKGDAPPTVNPSLWREAQLDAISGLFQITPHVYQVRGLSVASMTIIEGKTGLILIDTLASPGEAKAALDLYFAHRPKKQIVAVIYSHNHGDHSGGASAVVSSADAKSGKVKVIAPVGFMAALTQEGAVAGNLAGARGAYQFGGGLPVGPQGVVSYGEGETVSRPPPGAGSIIAPNDTITRKEESRTIDGVKFVFQLALDTEATSEMFVYIPAEHVLDTGETATHTLHNLLPIRGTLVRNALSWSRAMQDALDRFGPDVQVLINQHQWPFWGNAAARAALANHRDIYKYIHDQTLRMMNQGMAPADIADAITMPPGLENDWALQSYYGDLKADTRAVYQRYIGWYDGNPANLDRLPVAEEARKTVEYMGGAASAIARARADFKAGNYRWVVDVMNDVVFADPANADARNLAADAYEQMAYGAENAPWRDSYLLAAKQLRAGPPKSGGGNPSPAISPDLLHVMSAGQMFDYLGTRIDGPRAGAAKIVIAWRFTDSQEPLTSTLEHGALTWTLGGTAGKTAPNADVTVTTTRPALEAVILGRQSLADALAQGAIKTSRGNADALTNLWALLVSFKSIALIGPG